MDLVSLSSHSVPLLLLLPILFSNTLLHVPQVRDRSTKLQDITSGIASAIRQLCSCEFHTANIINQTFYCGELEHSVVYRAQISYVDSSGSRTSASFLALLETWLQSGATLSVNGSMVHGDTTCPPQVSSLEDPSCLLATSTEGTDYIVFIIPAVLGGVTAAVFLITSAIVVLVYRRRVRLRNAAEHLTPTIVYNGPKSGNSLRWAPVCCNKMNNDSKYLVSFFCSAGSSEEFVDNPQYGKHNY